MSKGPGIIDSPGIHTPTTNEPATDVSATGVDLPFTTVFVDFGALTPIVDALKNKGITHPFSIQALTLPVALRGDDIIRQAKTGTGKTLGSGIPMLENTAGTDEEGQESVPVRARGKPQGLAILSTREFAKQVAEELCAAAVRRCLRIVEVYGGRVYEPQQEALKGGTEIVVGIPGRLADLIKHRFLDLTYVRTVVPDEADEVSGLGFLEDVEKILASTPSNRHTMLFPVTMSGSVVAMARRYMSRPTHIRAADPSDTGVTVEPVYQVVYHCHTLNKSEVLTHILQAKGHGLAIVFARTKRTAVRLVEELTERGFTAGALHGDLSQDACEQALRTFCNGRVDVLAATDVAARGIDVDGVTHVINYQCPGDEKTYIYYIGRIGRAGQSGAAVTFVDWDDLPRWTLIDKVLNLHQSEPLETHRTSGHLYSDLDIPEGATGKLPRDKRTQAGLAAEHIEDPGETGRCSGKGRGGSYGRRGCGSSSGSGKHPSGQRQHEQAQRRGQSQRKKPIEENPQAAPRRSRQRKRTRRTDEP